MKILILGSPKIDGTKSIVSAGKKRGHEMIVKYPSHLLMLISDSVNGYDRIYDGFGQEGKPERMPANQYDAIIPRIGSNLGYGCAIVRQLNENLNIFSTQTADAIRIAADKLLCQQKLSQQGIRTPKTVYGNRSIFPDWMIKQVGGLPAIGKELTGSQGNTVYPLESNYQTNVFLKNFNKKRKNLLIQAYIDSGGKDVRVIVIDGKVIAAMERTAVKGEIRANISQGGSGKKIELSPEDQDLCVKAARACGHEVAGVDLLKDKEGKSYLLEVNSNYGYFVESCTGIDISTPLIEYCERNHKNGNKANRQTTAQFYGMFTSQTVISGSDKIQELTNINAKLNSEIKELQTSLMLNGIKDLSEKLSAIEKSRNA